ncbi:MAG: SGNH/GDSL hydrolase family protein [Gammaproteobacteria bacterium]|nr:SGNH/GDSL hydrolase family protein [Gammaproteobacteria bacterium]
MTHAIYRWLAVVVVACALLTRTATADENPHHLVVFGDSLSDPGNFYALTGQFSTAPYDVIPSAPYAIGGMHVSNGKTWVEYLAHELDTQAGPAYRDPRFSNYAVLGARARASGFMDLTTQVSSYFSHPEPSADTLYIIVIGGNDIRDAIAALASDPSGASSAQLLNAALTSVSDNLLALAASGANNFLIGTAPDLGLVPAVAYLGPQAQAAAHFFSVQYNLGLDHLLTQLQTNLPIQITRLDIYTYITQIINSPAQFNLTYTQTPCLKFGVIAHAVCQEPEQYFFWDGLHPTTHVHRLIADYAKQQLRTTLHATGVYHY